MDTTVSGSIEQVGNMVKGFQSIDLSSINILTIPFRFKELAQALFS